MPIYEYQSDDGEIIEAIYSIKEDRPESVEKDGKVFKKIFSLPTVIIDSKKPKTLGAQAQKNTERGLKEGRIKPKKAKEIPYWRKNKKIDLGLAKMNAKQKEKYIMTGNK